MSYRIDFGEPAETSLRRCATDRIEHAMAQLEDGLADDPEHAVHEARKDIKKARSLLRLYRGALGDATYRQENRALRDAGRGLSMRRDADVLLATVDDLADRSAGRLPARAFGDLRDELDGGRDDAPAVEEAAAVARRRLIHVLVRVDDWELDGADLVAGVRRAYARGRRAFARAQADPTDEHLHQWRKRVKDLRYQQQLLKPAWPEVLGAQAKAAKELSDRLGDDHDLAVLAVRAGDHDELVELIEQRRRELQQAAFALGRRVYAESPKRFGKRLARYVGALVTA